MHFKTLMQVNSTAEINFVKRLSNTVSSKCPRYYRRWFSLNNL